MKSFIRIVSLLFTVASLSANDQPASQPPIPPPQPPALTEHILVHAIDYSGKLTDTAATFTVHLDIELTGKPDAVLPLFDGELAVLTTKLPDHLRLSRAGTRYTLAVTKTGRHKLTLDLVAKIQRKEPWNQVAFTGPHAAIGSVTATATGTNTELQLLTGTQLEFVQQPDHSRVHGFLGPDRAISIRWQSRAAEVARKALLTCDTAANVQITPAIIKIATQIKYDIVQGTAPRLSIALPTGQALTRVQGDQIRDWQIAPEADRQLLTIDFIKPPEKSCTVTLLTEQPAGIDRASTAISIPQPLDVERETGSIAIAAEDVMVESDTLTGLRQVNAPAGTLAAYQFHGRPFTITQRIRRIEPVINVSNRLTSRIEETRLLLTHTLTLNVEKAGIYNVDLVPQPGYLVADVSGDGIENWNIRDGRLRIAFASRVLGARVIRVQLEQAHKTVPASVEVLPLRVTSAARETAQIGVTASPGIQIKTKPDEQTGLRELPIQQLTQRSDETLAFAAEQGDWSLTVHAARQEARVTAEIFNLVTIGDGLVGGSATIRYATVNQGVQQFRVQVPGFWKNVEFTGPIIRRKEETKTDAGSVWTISLQEKAWGGYTLVITYDYQFDPQEATLPAAGVHVLDAERETGSIAITSTANQELTIAAADAPLRRIDEYELAPAERALIARPVLIAYRYAGPTYDLKVNAKRFAETSGLQAVADRTQLTTVLTKEGDMMTQASFMVKNNDKQFQRVTLPDNASLWSCFVNNQAVKPESDGRDVLVPLPRAINRDQSFAVDIVYAQKRGALAPYLPASIALQAPHTDMQTTYAEWELFAPDEYRLLGFDGNMFVARGTTYSLQDVWREVVAFYIGIPSEMMIALTTLTVLGALTLIALVIGIRRGFRKMLIFAGGVGVVGLLAIMILPAMFTVSRSERTANAVTNMEQIDRMIVGGESDLAGAPMPMTPPSDKPAISSAVVSGIRPIRIDLPRQGQRYAFTKVLNVRNVAGESGGELLRVEATAIKDTVYKVTRGMLQAGVFVAGLALLWWQVTMVARARRSPFKIATGLAMVTGSVGSLFVVTRTLHVLVIMLPPALAVLAFFWIVIKLWRSLPPREDTGNGHHAGGADDASHGVPPAVAGLLALLVAGTAAQAAPEPVTTSITSATYTGVVTERAGQFEAVIDFVATEPNQQVRLFGEEVAVKQFSSSPSATTGWFGRGRSTGAAKLVRDGKHINVLLSAKGKTTIRLQFIVKVTGDVARRQVSFAIPETLSSRVNLLLDELEASVEFPGTVSYQSTTEGHQTRVEAVIGSGSKLDLTWTPRVKRAAEMAATVFAQNTSLASMGIGVMTIRTTLDYQVMQGELRQLRVLLPSDQRLMRVEGDLIRTWKVAQENAGPVLTVDLIKAVAPVCRLSIETEKVIATGASLTASVDIPHALDAKRETGIVALQPVEELSVTIEKSDGMQKVDVEEFTRALAAAPRSAPSPVKGITAAYRFVSRDAALNVSIEAMQPEIEAVVTNAVRLSTEQALLTSSIHYTIKRAGVFALRFAVPPDYRVMSVQGDRLAQWVEKSGDGSRTVEVTLKERTIGTGAIQMNLVRYWPSAPADFAVTGVHPIGTQKLTGFVSVSSDEGLELKSAAVEGLTEVPASSVATGASPTTSGSVLAYRFIATEPKPSPGWKLSVHTEQLESWVRAETVNWLTLTESLLSGRTLIRYEIQNAPIKELRLHIPEQLKNVDIAGAHIRRHDHEGTEWRVELQNKVRGIYLLTVTWDTPVRVEIEEKPLPLPGIEALGVERETGLIAVIAQPPLKITEQKAGNGVLSVDTRETPEWAGRPSSIPTMVYRYLRTGYELALNTRRFEEAAVLQAIIDQVRLTTVVAEDGQMMTELSLAIRNNGRQHLTVTLPANAEVWSAFVAGQPVRPSLRDGKLLLPLERSGSDGAPISVELVYAAMMPFPSTRGTVQLESPLVDLPLKNATWDLYLPPDYRYGDFKGTMTQQMFGAPSIESYSYGAYQQAEEVNKRASADNIRLNVAQMKSSLQTGKLKEASETYNRAKRQAASVADETAQSELKQLELQWRRDQAGNLVQQQQRFNDGSQAAANAPNTMPQGVSNVYDTKSAEEQVTKLQKAQEIAESQVTPLRVNLPRRGQHYTFAQALQTETDKALQLTFDATNTRAIAWPVTIALSAGAFLILWAALAMTRRRN